MQFPFLSVIVFIPMVAALLILCLKPEKKETIRITALTAALLALALSIWIYFGYDKAVAGYQFIEKYNWMPMLGISTLV
jgi:NADH-quinone oxidoreductase subunit M